MNTHWHLVMSCLTLTAASVVVVLSALALVRRGKFSLQKLALASSIAVGLMTTVAYLGADEAEDVVTELSDAGLSDAGKDDVETHEGVVELTVTAASLMAVLSLFALVINWRGPFLPQSEMLLLLAGWIVVIALMAWTSYLELQIHRR